MRIGRTPFNLCRLGTCNSSVQLSSICQRNLSLNLAEADRVLIREIDAALERIADRTYGLCEMTNMPIKEARLKELPWARYSIEAARRMEQGRA